MLQPNEYRNSRSLSQSDLKIFRRSVLQFYQQVELGTRTEGVTTKSTDIGDLVDCILTNPEGLKDYEIVSGVACSPAVKEIINDAFAGIMTYCEEKGLSETNPNGLRLFVQDFKNIQAHLIFAGRKAQYQKSYGDDALANTLYKHGGPYLNSLASNYGRNIIDKDVYLDALTAAARCIGTVNLEKMGVPFAEEVQDEGDPRIKPLLMKQSSPTQQVFKQLIMEGSFGSVNIKGLLDFGYTDEPHRWCFPFDVKTCFDLKQFTKNYWEYGYGYQGSWYSYLLKQLLPHHQIMPFRFIAVPTGSGEQPVIFTMSANEVNLFSDGGFTYQNQRIVGWKETLDEIAWHRRENRWDYPMRYVTEHEILIDSVYTEKDNGDPFA